MSALALGFAVYYLVEGRSGAAAASRPVATRQIVAPSPGSANDQGGAADAAAGSPVNRVPALPNELMLNATSLNVDQDDDDEQVLTLRRTDQADGRLSIVVADYVQQRKSWVRAWAGDTLSTKLTTFSIQAKDLVGDHGITIICMGMDDENEQTLVAFREKASVDPEGTCSFEEVLSLAADSIQIGEAERSEAYQLGQSKGDSWPVYAYMRDKDSANLLDQVKERYAWDPKAGRYAKTGSERIPGAQVERETVAKVLTGSEKDFETFLQGVWYESDMSPLDPAAKLILFDKDSDSISFYRPEAQEVYRWTESHPTRYGLYVRCQNDSVDNLVRLMDIELTGSDIVAIRVFEDLQMKMDPEDRWDGSFRKMPRDLPKAAGDSSKAPGDAVSRDGSTGLAKPKLKVEGPYRSQDGSELSFAQPRYSLKAPSAPAESGSFELYSLGSDTVLDLVALKPDGLSARKTYKLKYSETKVGKDLLRRIVLSPAKASIGGLELLQEDDLNLEQRVKGN